MVVGVPDVDVGGFEFDKEQGQAVDKADQVGPLGVDVSGDPQLGDQPEVVIVGLLPVDVAQGEAFGIAADGLAQTFSQGQQLVQPLVGADQAVVQLFFEGLDGQLEVGV